MTAGISPTIANQLLDEFGGTARTPAASQYVQLHTGDPGAAGTANAVAGPPRVQITGWNPATAASKSMASVPTWSNWSFTSPVTLTHISVWDAATSGNFQESVALTTAQQVTTGNNVQLTSLTFTIAPVAA